MGPTFVKLGQLLSTRSDLLPPVYLSALARLQDDVEPVPFEQIEETVTSEIGARISKAFVSFDATPAASASLGQVHHAVLRNGRRVAVKVQRPGVREQVVEDMEVIEELAEFVDRHTNVGRSMGFGGMVEEFRRSIMAELDYRVEAANLRLFHSNLADYDLIVVPQPIDDYSTSVVLTMELVDGRNVGSLGPLALQEIDGAALVRQLFDCYLDQILVDGLVHADPHPGNLMLTSDGRLALIDLGMVARIGPQMQDPLIRLLVALSDGQGTEVATIMSGLGEKRESWNPALFEREVTYLVQQHQIAVLGNMESGRVVGELARIAGQCGLRPPSELTMLSKALLNLDQVACKLDSNFDPGAAVREHVGEIMRRKMLQSASPANLLAANDGRERVRRTAPRPGQQGDGCARRRPAHFEHPRYRREGTDARRAEAGEPRQRRGDHRLVDHRCGDADEDRHALEAVRLSKHRDRLLPRGRSGRSLVDRHQPDARSPPATATPPALSHVPPVRASCRRGEVCEGRRSVVSTHQGRRAPFGRRVVGVGER